MNHYVLDKRRSVSPTLFLHYRRADIAELARLPIPVLAPMFVPAAEMNEVPVVEVPRGEARLYTIYLKRWGPQCHASECSYDEISGIRGSIAPCDPRLPFDVRENDHGRFDTCGRTPMVAPFGGTAWYVARHGYGDVMFAGAHGSVYVLQGGSRPVAGPALFQQWLDRLRPLENVHIAG
jgi:hypothetical protein